ncbi:unnamed protein product [Ceratitis capitata]|uniref:(Mediterranean fruit fly) hypothetical protein n=1 Tax=Ceratitis capitata TaxID=7213 RepID=A0A811UU77_CERCA|nr:unnamed protein product [Ceratitis capitata]
MAQFTNAAYSQDKDLHNIDCEDTPVGRAMTTIDNFEECITCCKGKQTRKIDKSSGIRAQNVLDIIRSFLAQ